MFSVTKTSNWFGLRTSCIAALSTYMWLSSMSGAFRATKSVTVLLQRTEVSSTLALSTEQSLFRRERAVAIAVAVMRSISDFL